MGAWAPWAPLVYASGRSRPTQGDEHRPTVLMEYGTLYALNTRMISRAPFESVDDAKCSWARTSVLSVCRDVCQLFADHNVTNTDINSACCYAIGFNNNKWIATCLVVRGRIAAATLRIMLSVLSVSTTRLDMPKCVTNSVISRGGPVPPPGTRTVRALGRNASNTGAKCCDEYLVQRN